MSAVAQGPRIYNLFPLLVGTVEDWTAHLDRIAAMGFNWIFVNPFNVTGSSGSLYAVKDYYRLNPVFRGKLKRSTDDLIKDFCAAARERGINVMMDLVINHTAKDSLLTEQHPDWFEREPDGRLKSPFCVDPADTRKKTVWEDLAEINYRARPERDQIIDYFRAVVRYYIGLGIYGFRCDAAYKVPKEVWRPLIEQGRELTDEAFFVAENLGALMEQVDAMRGAGFDYLFNSSKWWDFDGGWLLEQYEKFGSIAPSIAFPETHDTERLVTDLGAQGINDPVIVQRRYRQAYIFAAAFSAGVMMPIGYEYGFRRKLHVVKTIPADWEQPAFDLSPFIAAVNRMKATTPALNEEGHQRHLRPGGGRIACLARRSSAGPGWAAIFVNVDLWNGASARTDVLDSDMAFGREVTPGRETGTLVAGTDVKLEPGEVRIFASR